MGDIGDMGGADLSPPTVPIRSERVNHAPARGRSSAPPVTGGLWWDRKARISSSGSKRGECAPSRGRTASCGAAGQPGRGPFRVCVRFW